MAQTQNGYFLLRKVDASGFTAEAWIKQMEMEGLAGTYVEIDNLGDYFDDDRPRDTEFTTDIMASTLGWTLFDPSYKPVATYSRLDTALKAISSVKVTFHTELEIDEDEAEEAEPTSQLGQAARRAAGRPRRVETPLGTTDPSAPAG